MKKILVLMVALIAANVTVVNAQKIGRVLFQEVVLVLPDTDSVDVKIQNHAKQLEEEIEQMRVEFNNKIQDYESKKATYSAAIDAQKQRELSEYNTRYQEFTQTAQQELQSVQMSLTQPIFAKVAEAVSTVAKAQGVSMVVDLSQGNNILYVDEATSVDLTPLVKQSLGVDPNAKPKQQQAPAAQQ